MESNKYHLIVNYIGLLYHPLKCGINFIAKVYWVAEKLIFLNHQRSEGCQDRHDWKKTSNF